MGIPVVVSTNGYGLPVKAVSSNAPVMTVASNGYGTPIILSDLGTPFVVEGSGPFPAPSGFRWDIVTEQSNIVTENGEPVVELVSV